MQILTLDNLSYDLNNLPEEVDENMRFAVLDNSSPQDPDFFFMPLIFLESFNSPAMVLKIGDDEVTMPLDWSIAVGDPQSSCDIEILPLTSLNDRGFEALCFNPLSRLFCQRNFKTNGINRFKQNIIIWDPLSQAPHTYTNAMAMKFMLVNLAQWNVS